MKTNKGDNIMHFFHISSVKMEVPENNLNIVALIKTFHAVISYIESGIWIFPRLNIFFWSALKTVSHFTIADAPVYG
jgi:hypothetical protein